MYSALAHHHKLRHGPIEMAQLAAQILKQFLPQKISDQAQPAQTTPADEAGEVQSETLCAFAVQFHSQGARYS